ncbi:MAG: hypothetical protein J5847_00005 [Clostridia bacterium]|nr:hypothetical protein [Clostridia bacterium]
MLPLLLPAVPFLLWCMAAFYLLFFFLLWDRWQQDTAFRIPLLMAGLTFGLFYDAFVLALGAFLGDGLLLKTLSAPRYILHGALTPLLLAICAEALESSHTAQKVVGVLTALLMLAGAAAGCRARLKALKHAGITRFVLDGETTPKWVGGLLSALSVVPTLVLIACGLVLWKKKGEKELTLAGALMFFFAGIGPATGHMKENFLFSMFGELGLVSFLWRYIKKKTIAP